jgi:FHS family L-fucose permease-like MFS transporter
MLVGVLIGTLTKNTTMAEVSPLVIAGMVIFAVSFCIISFVKIEEPQGDLSNVTYERSPLAFRHCLLGIIAIFFYVGIEIGVPNEMNMWISRLPFEGAAAVAGSLAAAYWFLTLCGRFLSTIISGKVSTRTQMITVSSVAILLLLCAIFTGNINISLFGGEVPLSCLFIFLCGLCTSIMWGGIFNLSTEGLGKYTAKASGLFMTMVVGGGVMPFIQDNLVRPVTGYLGSYWLIIAMIAYILFYSLWGSKNVNKDIKVD